MNGRTEVVFHPPGAVTENGSWGTPHVYQSWRSAVRAARQWMKRGEGWLVTIRPLGD